MPIRLLFLTKHLTRHTGTATAGKRRPGTGADGCVTFPAGQSGLSSALPGAGDHPCLQTALDSEAWQRPTEGTLPGATGTHMGSPPSLMQIGWFPGSPSLFMSKFSPHKFPPWSVSFCAPAPNSTTDPKPLVEEQIANCNEFDNAQFFWFLCLHYVATFRKMPFWST